MLVQGLVSSVEASVQYVSVYVAVLKEVDKGQLVSSELAKPKSARSTYDLVSPLASILVILKSVRG